MCEFFRKQDDPIYTPAHGPNTVSPINRNLYAIMGEENIFKMLEDFYLELGKSDIKQMFPDDLVEASKKSAAFFVGIMGGPPLYLERYGSPRMRMRHFPFKITPEFKNVWLSCFEKVLTTPEKYSMPAGEVRGFLSFLDGFSNWMVNTKSQ